MPEQVSQETLDIMHQSVPLVALKALPLSSYVMCEESTGAGSEAVRSRGSQGQIHQRYALWQLGV
eukprot:6461350-Amphidinium_carterae.1